MSNHKINGKRTPWAFQQFDSRGAKDDWKVLQGGKAGIDRPVANFSAIVADEVMLCKTVRLYQNTLRLVGIVATWDAFFQSENWFDIKPLLSRREQDRFRAFWDLVLEFWPVDNDSGGPVQFALAVLIQKKMEKGYAKFKNVTPDKFGVGTELEIKIRDYVSTHYEALMGGA